MWIVTLLHKKYSAKSMMHAVYDVEKLTFVNPVDKGLANWLSSISLVLTFMQVLSFAAPPDKFPKEVPLNQIYSLSMFDMEFVSDLTFQTKLNLYLGFAFALCLFWSTLGSWLILALNEDLHVFGRFSPNMKSLQQIPMLDTWVNFFANTCFLMILPKLLKLVVRKREQI